MAFSFNNFVNNQVASVKRVLSPQNIIDRVTPGQVKSLVKADPKKILDQKLGNLSGVKLGQTFKEAGAKFKDSVLDTVNGMASALEAQIVGCLNKAIRDILNKNPILEKIIFFEDFINRELSKIRNKLESKIDSELRKIAYKKIKVQQVALYKQKVLSSIKKVCPGASPASPSQVQQYRDIVKGIVDKNKDEGVIVDTDENLPLAEVNNITKPEIPVQQTAKKVSDVTNNVKKKAKEDPDEFDRLKEETLAESKKAIQTQAEKQIKGQSNQTWRDLLAA